MILKITTKILFLFLILSFYSSHGQQSNKELIGIYNYSKNKFELFSSMEIKDSGLFVFRYAVGGCQGEINGNWKLEKNKLRFTSNPDFLNNEYINYPNLNLITWTIKKRGIKPDNIIDCGCLEVESIYYKK